ncbi:MAG TPA: hypothetical protein VF057_06240, partial [Thermoanaerobaculia bacterium]
RDGETPWWNFHDFGGQPLAGNPNSLTFYPDNILYLVLPAHAAFNLHFLLHLIGGFVAMRALCGARGADRGVALASATIWTLSGVVVSSTAFYNLVTGVALIPLALLAVERRSARLLGLSFGLLILGSEPMTILGAALAVAIAGIGRMRLMPVAIAIVLAAAIGAPQIVAYSEIAGEVERSVPISTNSMLATSLTWTRVAEIFVWPFEGFLNDAGGNRVRLFSTIFVGIVAIPALFQRSRYTAIALACLFLALGANNPVVRIVADLIPPPLRAFRFPEKLALPMTAALVVLMATFLTTTRFRRAWLIVAIAPLVWTTYRALPVDWFEPYRVEARPTVRVHWRPTIRAGSLDARDEYRKRAASLDWMFGAVANIRYAIGRSPDLMHSLMSRAVAERYESSTAATKERYLRINGCNVPGALPMAVIVPSIVPARGLIDAIRHLESPSFDERRTAVAPAMLQGFRSAPGTITRYVEEGQTIRINVHASGPVLLMVNQTFFESWVARIGDRELDIVPLNVDRLGIIVPGGEHEVALRFGRRRTFVMLSWIASILLIVASAARGFVEKVDGRPGEVQRSADEDRSHAASEGGVEG